MAGCPAQDPAHKRAEVFLILEGFAIADLNVFDSRCSNDSGVALEVALRFAESYRRNGMLSLDIKEFGAQGETNVGTGTDPTIAGTLKEMPTFAKPG